MDSNKVVEAYKLALNGANGNLVLADLVQEYVLNTNFDRDPYTNAYRDGARDLVLRLLALAHGDVERATEFLLKKRGESYGE